MSQEKREGENRGTSNEGKVNFNSRTTEGTLTQVTGKTCRIIFHLLYACLLAFFIHPRLFVYCLCFWSVPVHFHISYVCILNSFMHAHLEVTSQGGKCRRRLPCLIISSFTLINYAHELKYTSHREGWRRGEHV